MWLCLVFLVCNVATSFVSCTWVREHELSSNCLVQECFVFLCSLVVLCFSSGNVFILSFVSR
ncbi:hypothetical protein RchiOBHm_Chr2g0148561 [Rosa chinensis]|uniref:Uncharacterized protein n=1 Tax=Rosa chinensis TaxID=74649 RepID=A0A2P6RZG8_ROSCH|nr:hypothetical protein RchiOBHm_Chr2g0148561 [Rosa chinensis]